MFRPSVFLELLSDAAKLAAIAAAFTGWYFVAWAIATSPVVTP